MTTAVLHSNLAEKIVNYPASEQIAYITWACIRREFNNFQMFSRQSLIDYIMNHRNCSEQAAGNYFRAGLRMKLWATSENAKKYRIVGKAKVFEHFLDGIPPGKAALIAVDSLMTMKLQAVRGLLANVKTVNKSYMRSKISMANQQEVCDLTIYNRRKAANIPIRYNFHVRPGEESKQLPNTYRKPKYISAYSDDSTQKYYHKYYGQYKPVTTKVAQIKSFSKIDGKLNKVINYYDREVPLYERQLFYDDLKLAVSHAKKVNRITCDPVNKFVLLKDSDLPKLTDKAKKYGHGLYRQITVDETSSVSEIQRNLDFSNKKLSPHKKFTFEYINVDELEVPYDVFLQIRNSQVPPIVEKPHYNRSAKFAEKLDVSVVVKDRLVKLRKLTSTSLKKL